jgi:G3E family GTPase
MPNPPASTVLTVGFLGAGKTTFLRELLPLLEARGLAPYVILNDHQNARVDAGALRAEGRDVLPISGSCVCCDSLTELIEALLAVPPHPRRVILIEANGTSDPIALIEHLLAHAELRAVCAPILQAVVVDVRRWQKRRWHNDLEAMQARGASHVVLNRAAEASVAEAEAVAKAIEAMNPRALPTTAIQLADELAEFERPAGDGLRFFAAPAARPPGPTLVPAHRHELSHAFVATQLALPDRVDATVLQTWLRSLPPEVLRVKGVAYLNDLPGVPFLFQRTDDRPQGTLFPLTGEPTVEPCAILIGVRLETESLAVGLAEHLLAPSA